MGAKNLDLDRKCKIDFDFDATARRSLLEIINEEARLLYPFEVAWYLSISQSQVYDNIPRVRPNGPVRYCPKTIKALKGGIPSPGESRSLKIESKKSIGLSKSFKKGKRKAAICL